MHKLIAFLLLLLLAIAIAGAYGIVHNQISYTVSPEYFTKFKFEQFDLLDSALPERIRASIIGFHAASWMGIPIGLLVGAVGLVHPGARRMLRVSLWSFVLVAVFTLFVGLLGLAYGIGQTASVDLQEYRGWYVPSGVEDLRGFLCAGYMHNSSYLGGGLGILVGWTFHLVIWLRT